MFEISPYCNGIRISYNNHDIIWMRIYRELDRNHHAVIRNIMFNNGDGPSYKIETIGVDEVIEV